MQIHLSLNGSCQTGPCFTAFSFSAKVSRAAFEIPEPGKKKYQLLVVCRTVLPYMKSYEWIL